MAFMIFTVSFISCDFSLTYYRGFYGFFYIKYNFITFVKVNEMISLSDPKPDCARDHKYLENNVRQPKKMIH